MSKLSDAILRGMENLFPLTMQFIYRLYMYYWLKSCGFIMAEDVESAKAALTKED